MESKPGPLAGLQLFSPKVFSDARGYFLESYNIQTYQPYLTETFVQDNESYSTKDVLRGLHFQIGDQAQGKLVRVVTGEILDVVVDVRPDSATFAQSASFVLSGENKQQLWVPPGFAHGFIVRSNAAVFSYKCTQYYNLSAERTLAYNDPALQINWGSTHPIVNERDQSGQTLDQLQSVGDLESYRGRC